MLPSLHTPSDLSRLKKKATIQFKREVRRFSKLRKHGYSISEALDGPSYSVGKKISPEFQSVPFLSESLSGSASSESKSTPEQNTSWAVIVLGYVPLLSNIAQVFEYCVKGLGRDKVILIANFQEQYECLIEAARTGYPVFSDQFTNAENKQKQAERLVSLQFFNLLSIYRIYISQVY